jgi:2'-hydroxyisoflavone reductase
MNRREAMKLGTAATAGILISTSLWAQSRPIKVLILGGTGFIGPHFVRVCREGGHTLTLFNRGKRNPRLFPDIETLIGDRDGRLEALKGRDWDVCIDNSGYFPAHVQLSADLLKDHVQHYIYVSSVSAYADFTTAGLDEDHKLAQLKDSSATEITDENYGALKACARHAARPDSIHRRARPCRLHAPVHRTTHSRSLQRVQPSRRRHDGQSFSKRANACRDRTPRSYGPT